MESKDITTYLDLYETCLKLKLGYAFSYRQLINLLPNHPFIYDAIQDNNPIDDFSMPWYELFDRAYQKILAITKNPKQQIQYDPKSKLPNAIIEVPYIKLDTYDIEIPNNSFDKNLVCIYENRFIVYLIDNMLAFLKEVENKVLNKVKKLSSTWASDKLKISDINIYQDSQKFASFYNLEGFATLTTYKRKELLSTEDSIYSKTLKKVNKLIKSINDIKRTPFYLIVKQQEPIDEKYVHTTTLLNEDKDYAPCYEFYQKVLTKLKLEINQSVNKISSPVIDKIKYHNFVVLNLIALLYKKNFTSTWPHKDLNIFFNRKNLVQLVNFAVIRNNIKITLNTYKEDEIKLTISINKLDAKLHEQLKTSNREYVSCVILKIIPNFVNNEDDDLIVKNQIDAITSSYINAGYDRCFVVSNQIKEINNLVLASPFIYKSEHNLETMLESCLIFLRGDKYVYSKVCPICGAYIKKENYINGNIHCFNCHSVYSLLNEDEDGSKKDTVWLKKLN